MRQDGENNEGELSSFAYSLRGWMHVRAVDRYISRCLYDPMSVSKKL